MPVFEFLIVTTSESGGDGTLVDQPRLSHVLEDEALDVLEPILAPYSQLPGWYFSKFNWGRPPVPWAMACLDREYPIPGHIVTARPADSGVSFVPYLQTPDPIPPGYVPKVGILTFMSKVGLERAASASSVFQIAWEALRTYPPDRHWLVARPASRGLAGHGGPW